MSKPLGTTRIPAPRAWRPIPAGWRCVRLVDPVFSSGVMFAMQSGAAAAEAIGEALREPARRRQAFRRFERLTRRGPRVFSWFIYRMTRPAMKELFMAPRNVLRMKEALLSLLAGDIFGATPIWPSLHAFKLVYYASSLKHPRASLAALRARMRHPAHPARAGGRGRMSSGPSLRLEYVTPAESRFDNTQGVLGAAAFADGAPVIANGEVDFPLAHVHTPVLSDARETLEVWRAAAPRRRPLTDGCVTRPAVISSLAASRCTKRRCRAPDPTRAHRSGLSRISPTGRCTRRLRPPATRSSCVSGTTFPTSISIATASSGTGNSTPRATRPRSRAVVPSPAASLLQALSGVPAAARSRSTFWRAAARRPSSRIPAR